MTADRAYCRLSRHVRFGRGGKGGAFLVAHMDPIDGFLLAERVGEAIQGVPHDNVNSLKRWLPLGSRPCIKLQISSL